MSGLPADRNAPFAAWTPELIDQACAEHDARAAELNLARQDAYAEGRKDEAEARAADCAAEKLIDAWVMAKGKPVPWATAVEIISIVQKLSEAERARLLTLWEDE